MCIKDSKQLKPQRQQIHHSQPPASDQHQDAAQPRVIEAGPIESVINMFQINHVHLQMDTHCLILAGPFTVSHFTAYPVGSGIKTGGLVNRRLDRMVLIWRYCGNHRNGHRLAGLAKACKYGAYDDKCGNMWTIVSYSIFIAISFHCRPQ